jgi:uncharacterized repeat protein (TIGR03803 family)
VLYAFTTDDAGPTGIVLHGGNLFGFSNNGQTVRGAVFELVAPQGGGAWTKQSIYNFPGNAFPTGGAPLITPNGDIYGVAQTGEPNFYGLVFKLAKNASGWTYQTLYQFTNNEYPTGTLVMDASGALYGVTADGGFQNNGEVFKLTPPANRSAWTETTLYEFKAGSDGREPGPGVVLDAHGNLFGTTEGGGTSDEGTVFELTPPAQGSDVWGEAVLYSFTLDQGSPGISLPVLDSQGNLWGNAFYLTWKLAPPQTGTAWTLTDEHNFNGPPDGGLPVGGVTAYKNDYIGATNYPGKHADHGTVFKIVP